MREDSIELKVLTPLLDKDELDKIDNFYNNIVDDYLNNFVKDKERFILNFLLRKFRDENKHLKALITNLYNEYQNNNISAVTVYQVIKMQENIHKEEINRLTHESTEFESKVYELQNEKEQLIKYLEDFISKTNHEVDVLGNYSYLAWSNAYKKLLKRIKSGNYED